tara:strand:- start:117 stop:344 length:228 start_codon:yes stop_codon:yes gene_type:complete
MKWIETSKELPSERQRVLCLFNGEPIVLELSCESPTYEDTFKSFYFWLEPYDEILCPEWGEVTHWCEIVIPNEVK